MSIMLIILLLVFFALLALRLPVFLSLALPSAIYFIVEGLPVSLLAQRMFTGIDIFVLLAIPLFSLTGQIMNAVGLARHLLDFAQALVGWMRGGLAAMNVLTSMFFSGITGSAAADASVTGSMLIPMMKRGGYSAEFSAAITAMTAIVGPIIPPSIVFIMYATLSNTSVSALFAAGIMPGILMSGAHLATALLISRARGYQPGRPTSVRLIGKTGLMALPAMAVPAIIVMGILGGIVTPTEAGAVAVVAAVILGLARKTLKLSSMTTCGYAVGRETADIMLIIGASNVVAWILTVEGVPRELSALLLGVSENPVVVLIMVNLLILAVGMILDTFPALIILTAILLPVTRSIGIDPVHFGVIISLNLMIGAVTPPIGILLYIAMRIAKASFLGTLRETVPFLIASVMVLMIVSFVPALSSGVAEILTRALSP